WNYCWSPGATNGTMATNGTGGTLPEGAYQSLNPLNALVGSQLNGTWTIQICDMWASDNGFLCNWEIEFDPDLYPDLVEFTPIYGAGCDSSSWSGSNITSTSANCNDICVTPPLGSHNYTYTVTDDFGCTYDTTITVTIIPGPQVDAGPDLVSCGEPVDLDASITDGGFPSECTYTLLLFDYYGDGWNGGAEITVTVDGVSTDYTLTTGTSAYYQITVADGDAISLVYLAGTSFNNENSLTLSGPGNTLVYSSPQGPASGNLWTGAADCPGGGYVYSWDPPTGLSDPTILDPTATVTATTTYCVTVSQAGNASCSSTDCVTITIEEVNIDAGEDGVIALCVDDASTDLFSLLGGTPDAGGTWTDPTGATNNGTFDPATDAPGEYTYTVAGTGACGNGTASAIITVSVADLIDAGDDGAITVCPGDPVIDLFTALTGTPDPGGTWTAPDGTVSDGSFDPATAVPGVYTYIIAGMAPCPDVEASVTVDIGISADPGQDGAATLCASDPAILLFDQLGGTPDPGGIWTSPDGSASDGSFDPAVNAPGGYTYSFPAAGGCAAGASTVTITIGTTVNAGEDASTSLCFSSPAIDLFATLVGTPDPGGTWTDPTGTAFGGTFDPAIDPPGDYTYTVGGGNCPADIAIVSINVVTEPDPGEDGAITLCTGEAPIDLFDQLGGTPDAGGTWTAADGTAATAMFDPAIDQAGEFTYTITVPDPCVSVSSTVTIAITDQADAGEDAASTLCFSSPAIDLFATLGGTPDPGGTWTDPSGAAFGGTFDPAVDAPGDYSYT
ncbi:MAG: hypothetical protein M3R08_10080, partial [Bacteroidota bacterium]|nr:hypothetical protein [Bacteroidota bacterium]